MSACSDPSETRLVPIEPKTATHLERIAYDVDDELDKALLLQIAEAIYAAPADPLKVVAGALLSTHNEAPDDADRADAYVDASAVLFALRLRVGVHHDNGETT